MSPFESDIGSANDCEILPFEAHQREVAEDAIRDLLKWIGEDTGREGLLETPGRVVRAFEEYFSGYKVDPREYLKTVFTEINGYDDMVALTHIPFISHCEHHMAPIIGEAHVAYLPRCCRRHKQAGTGCRRLCAPSADSGASNYTNWQGN